MSREKVDLLQCAISNFVLTEPPPKLPLVNDEAASWFAQHGIVYHQRMRVDGRAFGFNVAGSKAIHGLAKALFAERPPLRAGTRMEALADAVANALLTSVHFQTDSQVTNVQVGQLEDAIDAWFKGESIARQFLIPCAILPQHASNFSVGPIHFFSIWDLAARVGVEPEHLTEHLNYGLLIRTMKERSAVWLAEIEICGLDERVATERANLAVDVALVAIQMSLPLFSSREISRITGRTMPSAIGTFFTTERGAHSSISRREPGLTISCGFFDQALAGRSHLIESVGRRVEAYVKGAQSLPKLEQAWSDAAFWLHEGLAEPLSTVAVAKLETSIEVLLSAESSKGSTARFEAAFESFYGLKSSDPIGQGDQLTVKAFVKSIVGARSRVLHGTSSTLSPETSAAEQTGRAVLEMLALDLVCKFTLALDAYAKGLVAVDETLHFLEWVSSKRQEASNSAPM